MWKISTQLFLAKQFFNITDNLDSMNADNSVQVIFGSSFFNLHSSIMYNNNAVSLKNNNNNETFILKIIINNYMKGIKYLNILLVQSR